ncbi:uncharacterized protein EI97DRAFT_421753 [Westerdykella ornata]|uniref:Uncharacterized protein n=1 Tax=Westerdykella ornata TaxID=318751 RepID=A0A6A6JDF9_WESOR|nr:uncharacterized protein EI97DRAFT_421753 [Westerdykella ornata]KAF2274640.1 hypothetical protein EI97DRAFT_421753 [Westerdykella ornata]
MPLILRASLASVVCPSAPFLAPRLLRRPAHLAAAHPFGITSWTCLQRSALTTKRDNRPRRDPKKSRDSKKGGKPPNETPWSEKRRLEDEQFRAQLAAIDEFMHACSIRDARTAMYMYPEVLDIPLLSREHTRRLAQALHAFVRIETKALEERVRKVRLLLPFLERFTADIRAGKWPPHPAAFVHILGLYKEGKCYEEGRKFWLWLVEQDDTYVDQAVYGAAIELLAYRGKDSLHTLEELYHDALKRFPGTFAEYHLSPEAVVPDRAQPTNIPGIPMALLQGILTVRILNRDWKNAYLALDTALRLYPTAVPQRFFEVFMNERPMSEAYTIFLLACRAGIVFKPSHLTSLISTKLRPAMRKVATLHERALLVRGSANAIYAYLEAGGTLEAFHVSTFLSTFHHLLPLQLGETYSPKEERIRNLIVGTAHKIITMLIQSGLPPSPQVFSALINLAAEFRVRELLDLALTDMTTSGADIREVERRVIIKAAGLFKDKELLEKYWAQVSARAESEGNLISRLDWIAFAKACRQAGCPDLFHKELDGLRHAIDSGTEENALKILNRKELPPKAQRDGPGDENKFAREFEEVERIMKNVAAVTMAGSPLDLKKTPFDMFLDVHREPIATEEDLRSVYDELTTDPHQPELPNRTANVSVSPTGIPLEELRFQNWVTIVELMADAEAEERSFQKQVDEAMRRGEPLDAVMRPLTFRRGKKEVEEIWGVAQGQEYQEGRMPSRLRLLKTVMRLRGPYVESPYQSVAFRKVELEEPQKAVKLDERVTETMKEEGATTLEPEKNVEQGVPARALFQPTPSLRFWLMMNAKG